MAYLAATLLNEYRAKYGNLDNYEHRVSRYGAFDAFVSDTPNLLPDRAQIEAGRADQNRATKIPVINKVTFTIGSTRTCTAQTKTNVSALVTVTYVTITGGFHMIPAQFRGNELSYQDDFNVKMSSLERDLLAHLDGLAVTKFGTIKSQVFAADGNPYDFTSDAIVVPAGDEETMFGELEAAFAQDDFYGNVHVVSSPRLLALVRHLGAQGPSNDENLAYQFAGWNFRATNRITPTALSRDTFYAYQQGSLAFLNWNDVDSQMGHKSTSGKEWSEQYLPKVGLSMGLLYQSDCGDQSTEVGSGFEASLKESFLFSTDVAFVSAYNSDAATYASPIYKVELKKQ